MILDKFFECFFKKADTQIKEDLRNLSIFTILQQTDYEGIKEKYCELVQGLDGKCYFKPIIGINSYTTDNAEMPSTENWPTSATTEEQYWELLDSYQGGVLERSPSCVSNLLNDIALNIPNSQVWVDAEKGLKLCIPDQVILDILRTDEIQINNAIIYSNKDLPKSNQFLADEVRAKILFEKCMVLLEDNFDLTSNAMKLLTQATISHLALLINWRFINIEFSLGIRCVWQSSKIDLDGDRVSIVYHTNWQVVSLEGKSVYPRYMKACVKISILKTDLELGSAGNAKMVETCSRFFDCLEDLKNEDLLPSEVDNEMLYQKKIEDYADCSYPILDEYFQENKFKSSSINLIRNKNHQLEPLNVTSKDSWHDLLLEESVKLGKEIDSLVLTQLPRYVESEINRIFENKTLNCFPICLDNKLKISINQHDQSFKVLLKSSWNLTPSNRIVNSAVELKITLLQAKDREQDNLIESCGLRQRNKIQRKLKVAEPNFVIEEAIQYFYLLKDSEKEAWIKA